MNNELRNLNTEVQEAMDGSPATARDAAGYINVKFQCGPVKEVGVNGTSIENVIDLLVKRLKGFQAGPFACTENETAIQCLNDAISILNIRTRRREAANVEGTKQPH